MVEANKTPETDDTRQDETGSVGVHFWVPSAMLIEFDVRRIRQRAGSRAELLRGLMREYVSEDVQLPKAS